MKNFYFWAILLFIVGIILFGVALFSYKSYQDYLSVLAYYGANEETYLKSDKIAEVIFNFKFGIIKYTIAGFTAWALSIFFLLKILRRR